MSFEVNIFIETTYKGPARRTGAAMWLVEYKRGDVPITRQGILKLEDGTENQAALMATIAALSILTKSCSCRVFTQCEHILNSARNCWHIQWQKNDWHNAKGKLVKNSELWQQVIEISQKHAITYHSGRHEYQNVMQIELNKEMERNG